MSVLTGIDQALLFWLNGSNSLFTDGVMSTLTAGVTWIPLYIALFYVVLKNNETMAQVLLTVGCAAACVLITAGITNLVVKPLVARPRPCDDPVIKYAIDVVSGVSAGNYSFFSAHAANTSALVMFMALLIRNRLFIVAMSLWSALNCYTRLYLGMHYPSDIIVGLMWGACVGFGVWFVFRRKLKQGCDQHDADLLITVFVFTLFMVVMISFLRLL